MCKKLSYFNVLCLTSSVLCQILVCKKLSYVNVLCLLRQGDDDDAYDRDFDNGD